MEKSYVLIDCGLIHKYLVRKEEIEKIEDETLYIIKAIKDLGNHKIQNKGQKIVLSNGPEKLVFKKTDSNDNIFKYFLDEFENVEVL